MAKSFQRAERVGDLIHAEIAKLLQHEVKDPRVAMVTITGVKVTRDLAHAKIYVAVHDEDNDKEKTLKGLERATGFLRKRLAQEVELRIVPQLHFHYDDTLTNAGHIDTLLRDL